MLVVLVWCTYSAVLAPLLPVELAEIDERLVEAVEEPLRVENLLVPFTLLICLLVFFVSRLPQEVNIKVPVRRNSNVLITKQLTPNQNIGDFW